MLDERQHYVEARQDVGLGPEGSNSVDIANATETLDSPYRCGDRC